MCRPVASAGAGVEHNGVPAELGREVVNRQVAVEREVLDQMRDTLSVVQSGSGIINPASFGGGASAIAAVSLTPPAPIRRRADGQPARSCNRRVLVHPSAGCRDADRRARLRWLLLMLASRRVTCVRLP